MMHPTVATEIERKFLVCSDGWRQGATATRALRQGYLALDDGNSVRVRTDRSRAWLTIKGRASGMTRPEFEYEIPAADAEGLLELCRGRVVEKTRHLVPSGAHVWEVDEFCGDNAGLVVAEIELPEEEAAFSRPDWVGQEVTADSRYLNANLALHPYCQWAR